MRANWTHWTGRKTWKEVPSSGKIYSFLATTCCFVTHSSGLKCSVAPGRLPGILKMGTKKQINNVSDGGRENRWVERISTDFKVKIFNLTDK